MFRSSISAVLLAVSIVLLVVTLTATHIWAQPARAHENVSVSSIVDKYFKILNAGMQNGQFSAMSSVYARDAVLTQSNPLGETKVSRGLAQITAFYEAAYTRFKGGHWTQDSRRVLSRDVVLNYEFAGDSTFKVPGRCAHIFVIRNGKIKSVDWVTFYSGQK